MPPTWSSSREHLGTASWGLERESTCTASRPCWTRGVVSSVPATLRSPAVTLRQALDVWRGDAYAEFAHEEWVLPEAQRLEELRVIAVERLVDAELACGRSAESIARLETLVAEHPLREGFRSQLMLALYRSGRQVDTCRAYRDYRTTLADEIGLDPSPALADLERRILGHDPASIWPKPQVNHSVDTGSGAGRGRPERDDARGAPRRQRPADGPSACSTIGTAS